MRWERDEWERTELVVACRHKSSDVHVARLTQKNIDDWKQGYFLDSYRKLGAHANERGTWFRVWAPDVDRVSVIGDFNDWNEKANFLKPRGRGNASFWEVHVANARPEHRYKYSIKRGKYSGDKADPFGVAMEPPEPGGSATRGLSSIITDMSFEWSDDIWISSRAEKEGRASLKRAMSIYEVHLGSWRRAQDGSHFSYSELADPLIAYVHDLGFTHVEFLPILEHPFYASWGYQVAGYFAPTHRYGSPKELKKLINLLHEADIGVFLDWVPAHFATDAQGLAYFTGRPLFEYEDPLMQHHPDWGTNVFDYANPCVRNYLISNALFWLDEYHIDGLRFDAVASMLYRDYSRDTFSPNRFGGRENLESCDLLRDINDAVAKHYPHAIITAEEATAWPSVTGSTEYGGLGFHYKWNMGWMNDTLEFMKRSPRYRSRHFNDFTFPLMYAFSENYTLPLSHDEVVHEKGSLWGKMPGNNVDRSANLRLLLAHQFGHPGKKLLFMGAEFGQVREWSHDRELDWNLLSDPLHAGIQAWVKELNVLYRSNEAMWDDTNDGFEWIDFSDSSNGVAGYLRKVDRRSLIFVFNFSTTSFKAYKIGAPQEGRWKVLLNSQARKFGGSGLGSRGTVSATSPGTHGRPATIALSLPKLTAFVLAQTTA